MVRTPGIGDAQLLDSLRILCRIGSANTFGLLHAPVDRCERRVLSGACPRTGRRMDPTSGCREREFEKLWETVWKKNHFEYE